MFTWVGAWPSAATRLRAGANVDMVGAGPMVTMPTGLPVIRNELIHLSVAESRLLSLFLSVFFCVVVVCCGVHVSLSACLSADITV